MKKILLTSTGFGNNNIKNKFLELLNCDVKQAQENPSVGIILCSSKDKDVVEYSLSKNMSL